jgi:hypothetical protein
LTTTARRSGNGIGSVANPVPTSRLNRSRVPIDRSSAKW